MTEARDFKGEEIAEISQYIQTNIPYSVLQQIFPLTEVPENKIKAFTIMYRMINGAMNYVEEPETRKKIEELLKECESIYIELYSIYFDNNTSSTFWGSHLRNRLLKNVIVNSNNMKKINKLIDIFLIFSEKQILLDKDKVIGIELDTKEGVDLKNKLLEGLN